MHLLDLPEDVLTIIFFHLISNSNVEDVIELETTCRQIRRLCSLRESWIAVLETLNSRPPFKASRSTLLSLDAAELRSEIIRAVKLDRSWKAGNGPLQKETIVIPFASMTHPRRRAYVDFRIIPEAGLILACLWRNGLEAWSISAKETVWTYMDLQVENEDYGHTSPNYYPITVGYEVADDASRVTFALLYTQTAGEMFIRVLRLDTHTYSFEVLYESPPMPVFDIQPNGIHIRDAYVVVAHSFVRDEVGFLVLNWHTNLFYRVKGPVSPSKPASALTTSHIFYAFPVTGLKRYCLACVRYREIVGSSSSIATEWPTYKVSYLDDLGAYSVVLLPYDTPPLSVHRHLARISCQVSAVVSTWSKNPITQITMTTYSATFNTQWPRVNIYGVEVVCDDDGREMLALKHHHSSQKRIMFATDLSIAGRAMVRRHSLDKNDSTTRIATELCTFAAVAEKAGDGGEGTATRREYRTVKFEDSHIQQLDPNAMFQTMDPLGRMLVYASRQGMLVVKFDE